MNSKTSSQISLGVPFLVTQNNIAQAMQLQDDGCCFVCVEGKSLDLEKFLVSACVRARMSFDSTDSYCMVMDADGRTLIDFLENKMSRKTSYSRSDIIAPGQECTSKDRHLVHLMMDCGCVFEKTVNPTESKGWIHLANDRNSAFYDLHKSPGGDCVWRYRRSPECEITMLTIMRHIAAHGVDPAWHIQMLRDCVKLAIESLSNGKVDSVYLATESSWAEAGHFPAIPLDDMVERITQVVSGNSGAMECVYLMGIAENETQECVESK